MPKLTADFHIQRDFLKPSEIFAKICFCPLNFVLAAFVQMCTWDPRRNGSSYLSPHGIALEYHRACCILHYVALMQFMCVTSKFGIYLLNSSLR